MATTLRGRDRICDIANLRCPERGSFESERKAVAIAKRRRGICISEGAGPLYRGLASNRDSQRVLDIERHPFRDQCCAKLHRVLLPCCTQNGRLVQGLSRSKTADNS